jgi:hypothetical protein
MPNSEELKPKAIEPEIVGHEPKIYTGDLTIQGTRIKCFVLDLIDGQEAKRLLSGRATTKAFGLTGRGQGMSRFLSSARLREQMSERLIQAIEEPIQFSPNPALPPVLGYEAWVLPELCNAILDANDKQKLPAQQQKIVQAAKILSRGLAITGITAIVDEAAGYQEVRDRLALQKILNKYISKEMQPYVRMFRDDFYKQMWRLLGWEWRGMSVPKPMRVGQLTDDWVYKRLAPGVREALRSLVPRTEKGNLTHKLHSHLTPEEGRQALDRHLHAVTALMTAATTLKGFERMVDRAFPKFGETIPLNFGEDDNT